MIISASRRTDIPAFYADWVIDSLKRGRIHTSRLDLEVSPETVDCIVFWTKNPEPMLARLHELEGYQYYFQFTLTGYGPAVEPAVPDKHHMLEVFKRLSDMVGADRVIWRYDPVFYNCQYTAEYHSRAFDAIARELNGYTQKCVFSFCDFYGKVTERMKPFDPIPAPDWANEQLATAFAQSAHANGMTLATCAEGIDLAKLGIEHNACIDGDLISRLTGKQSLELKDPSQRSLCRCVKSIDIGEYRTCKHKCAYCYAC